MSQVKSDTNIKAFEEFQTLCNIGAHNNMAVNLIQALDTVIKNSKETTMQGLMVELKSAGEIIIEKAKQNNLLGNKSNLVLSSAHTTFLHYINKGLKHSLGNDMKQLKRSLISITNDLLQILKSSRTSLIEKTLKFLRNRQKILVFGNSEAVQEVIENSQQKNLQLDIVILEGRPFSEGVQLYLQLKKRDILSTLVYDSAMCHALQDCDMVLTGAESVVENGGIINRIGTYQLALLAKAFNKPFYVIAESFKFARIFPLQQKDLPENLQVIRKFPFVGELVEDLEDEKEQVQIEGPLWDYTPPNLISLLFTDVGTFTPSAVSEELIQIFID